MRKWKWLGFAAMAILMSMNLVSCSQENDAVLPEQPTEEYVTVNLGVTGEYLDLSESPLRTRAEGELKDAIAIKVWTVTNNNVVLYAHGVFTSLENVSIKLLKGQKYKFATSIVVDECNSPEDEYSEDTDGDGVINIYHHECVFGLNTIGSNFIYSTYDNLENFDVLNESSSAYYDRFYGELAEYTPTEDGVVEISTKRTVYGVYYIAEGLKEGKLIVKVNNSSRYLYSVEISSENPESDGIYTFSNIRSAWEGIETINMETEKLEYVNYYTTKQLTFSWEKDDGSETSLGTYDVTFKRNVKTTIQINVEESGLQNGIVITREEAAMTDDENKYVIEGGEITEVPVTQQ